MSLWLLLQSIHGHLGVLALAACLHPVFSLRAKRPSARARLSGYLAAALMLLTSASGWWIYPAYRADVKRRLYEASYTAGQLFETKEHLAFFALCLALAGAALLFAADAEHGATLRRPARVCWTLCAACSLAVAVLGVVVSSVAGFQAP